MTVGFFWISSGVPSAMVAPKSTTLMREHRLHDDLHLMLDHPDGHREVVVNPAHQFDEPFHIRGVQAVAGSSRSGSEGLMLMARAISTLPSAP